MGNLCCAREHPVQVFVQFIFTQLNCTVKLRVFGVVKVKQMSEAELPLWLEVQHKGNVATCTRTTNQPTNQHCLTARSTASTSPANQETTRTLCETGNFITLFTTASHIYLS
jgi:hypothetical protein